MTFVDTMKALIHSVINSIRVMNLDELRPYGNGKLTLRHPEGHKIELTRDGAFYDGVEIGTGGPALWETDGTTTSMVTPQTVDVEAQTVKNVTELKGTPTSNVVITIDDGQALVIQKQSL